MNKFTFKVHDSFRIWWGRDQKAHLLILFFILRLETEIVLGIPVISVESSDCFSVVFLLSNLMLSIFMWVSDPFFRQPFLSNTGWHLISYSVTDFSILHQQMHASKVQACRVSNDILFH
jgi:hypothetical protein